MKNLRIILIALIYLLLGTFLVFGQSTIKGTPYSNVGIIEDMTIEQAIGMLPLAKIPKLTTLADIPAIATTEGALLDLPHCKPTIKITTKGDTLINTLYYPPAPTSDDGMITYSVGVLPRCEFRPKPLPAVTWNEYRKLLQRIEKLEKHTRH